MPEWSPLHTRVALWMGGIIFLLVTWPKPTVAVVAVLAIVGCLYLLVLCIVAGMRECWPDKFGDKPDDRRW